MVAGLNKSGASNVNMKYLIKLITKHYYLTSILILGLTLYFGYNLKDLRIDNGVLTMLPDDHISKISQ